MGLCKMQAFTQQNMGGRGGWGYDNDHKLGVKWRQVNYCTLEKLAEEKLFEFISCKHICEREEKCF